MTMRTNLLRFRNRSASKYRTKISKSYNGTNNVDRDLKQRFPNQANLIVYFRNIARRNDF